MIVGAPALVTQTAQSATQRTAADLPQQSASFSEFLSTKASEMAASVQNAETVSMNGFNGTADIREVVDAVMQAERNLQAAVAVREKLVSAYLDLSRMTI